MNLGILGSSSTSLALDSYLTNSNAADLLATKKDYTFIVGCETGPMQNVVELLEEKGCFMEYVGLAGSKELENSSADVKITATSPINRTEIITNESDALLFLSGGIGTRAEFYSALTTKLELNTDKPLIIYNEDHSYDTLLKDMDQAIKQGSMTSSARLCFDVAMNTNELDTILKKYENKTTKEKSK